MPRTAMRRTLRRTLLRRIQQFLPAVQVRLDLPETIPSGYGQFLNSYFPLIRKFTGGVIERMSDKDWLEIGYWAHHIAIWIPGFPDRDETIGA